MSEPNPVYLTAEQLADADLVRLTSAAKIYDIPVTTLNDAVQRGALPCTIDGNGTRRFRRSDLLEWLAARGTPKLKGAAAERAAAKEGRAVA